MCSTVTIHHVSLLIKIGDGIMREVDRHEGLTVIPDAGTRPPDREIVRKNHGQVDDVLLSSGVDELLRERIADNCKGSRFGRSNGGVFWA